MGGAQLGTNTKCISSEDGPSLSSEVPPCKAVIVPTPGRYPDRTRRNPFAPDVNPHPLGTLVPSHGLLGCFSGDETWIQATAWEPYQELFQSIARCLHSDFRIGGLAPGETKRIRGRMPIVHTDAGALLQRYGRDSSGH